MHGWDGVQGLWQEMILGRVGGILQILWAGLELRIFILSALGSCRKILSVAHCTACYLFNCQTCSIWGIRGEDSGGWGTDGTVETEECTDGDLPRQS